MSNELKAQANSRIAAMFFIGYPYLMSFFIIEKRQVECSRHMTLFELLRASGIN
jgi:hypothetical protein